MDPPLVLAGHDLAAPPGRSRRGPAGSAPRRTRRIGARPLSAMTWGEPPALLTRTSSRPNRSTAAPMTRRACSGWRTSAVTNVGPLDLGLVAAAGDHAGPGVEERGHDAGPDAAGAAGDHHHLIGEVEGRLRHGRPPYGTDSRARCWPARPGSPKFAGVSDAGVRTTARKHENDESGTGVMPVHSSRSTAGSARWSSTIRR